jgi:hypothetical protein
MPVTVAAASRHLLISEKTGGFPAGVHVKKCLKCGNVGMLGKEEDRRQNKKE